MALAFGMSGDATVQPSTKGEICRFSGEKNGSERNAQQNDCGYKLMIFRFFLLIFRYLYQVFKFI